jgi:hypothetical protein
MIVSIFRLVIPSRPHRQLYLDLLGTTGIDEIITMPAFLKIENIGVCPPEGFTVLGVSLADTSSNEGVIGQFGSGNKNAVAVLLRHGLSPVVFAGTLKLEFSTKPQTVADGLASKEFG